MQQGASNRSAPIHDKILKSSILRIARLAVERALRDEFAYENKVRVMRKRAAAVDRRRAACRWRLTIKLAWRK